MAEKKLVKRDYFEMLKAIPEVAGNEGLVNFIDHELELLAKKSSKSGVTKTQKENEPIKQTIIDTLAKAGKRLTISEMQELNGELKPLSNQKISALLTQLCNAKQVDRIKEKKLTYFVLLETSEVEDIED